MSEKVFISQSNLGKGVFAKEAIAPRELIFYMNGKEINFERSTVYMGEYSVQTGVKTYVDPIAPARYLNHSCSPNAGFIDDISLIALTRIKPGEEIRFDYSTTMLERHWELDCACGSRQCRRRIRDFDFLPYSLQQHYLQLGIVQQFILNEVASLSPVAV